MNDEKNVAEYFLNRIDEKGFKAYYLAMQDDETGYHLKSFWDLETDKKLNDRFRIFAWVTLWKRSAKATKNRVAPSEEEVVAFRAKLYNYQMKIDAAKAAAKQAEEDERHAYFDFKNAVGIQDYHEHSVYIANYMNH